MLWKSRWLWLLAGVWAVILTACSIDSHLQDAVKVEDPFMSEDERDFSGLVITYFALPHGESTLVMLPDGKKLLIDTGSAKDWPTLYNRLSERKVTRLDYVVITNDEPEYSGGYPYLAERVVIDRLMVAKLLEPVLRKAVHLPADKKLLAVSDNDVVKLDENVSMQVLLPSEPMFLSPQDNSLVFRLQHGRLRFLFTSGMNEKAEERLLSRHFDQVRAEVLKVGDQGSNQGSSQPFLSRVDPQVAIVQTGQPRDKIKESQAEVLERLGESWAETYLTSQYGSITILSNGKDYRILKQKK